MGTSNSKQDQSFDFNAQEWLPDNQILSEEPNSFIVLRNAHTGELVDKYTIDLSSENDYNFYIESLKWRKN